MPTDPIMVCTKDGRALQQEPRIFAHLLRIGETIWHEGSDSDGLWVVIEVTHHPEPAITQRRKDGQASHPAPCSEILGLSVEE